MNFLSSFNISGSAMTAQKLRMDIIAQNIANAQATRTESGQPYKRKMVVMRSITPPQADFRTVLENAKTGTGLSSAKASTAGVKIDSIVEDNSPFVPVYNPGHPDADENGYVMLSNVNTAQEMIDMMAASRAFESNVTVFNATKAMAMKALEIGR